MRILSVGKLKKPFWQQAAGHYLRQLSRHVQIEQMAIKDGASSLPVEERKLREGESILARLSGKDRLVCLDERGTNLTSKKLAARLKTWLEDPATHPCFVLGGAYGLHTNILRKSHMTWSLGAMTLPHELAQVVLLEQLFRAMSINLGMPYHH